MRKIVLIMVLLLIILITFSACKAQSYPFEEPVENIVSVEVIDEGVNGHEVLKTLSEEEMNAFLEDILTVEYYRYYYGHPNRAYGIGFKITYESGAYELLSYATGNYVNLDGSRKYHFIYTKDKGAEQFNALLRKYYDPEYQP
ncbi:MAG: hypothetical protein E7591_09460 [Ruminococcaceae bacterium]|nr:hypothetical protein [Oscillospiraceae bacterium]